jgi:hypothetical protein
MLADSQYTIVGSSNNRKLLIRSSIVDIGVGVGFGEGTVPVGFVSCHEEVRSYKHSS